MKEKNKSKTTIDVEGGNIKQQKDMEEGDYDVEGDNIKNKGTWNKAVG